MGFAFWASVSGLRRSDDGIRARVIALGDMPQHHYASELFNKWKIYGVCICLLYLSRDDWFTKIGNGKCSHIKVIFETNDLGFHLEKGGISLEYEQDVYRFNETNEPCLVESIQKAFICKSIGNDHLKYPSH